ncbi:MULTISPECIES: hypothetical protein [Virgibacillus]|uniref:Uncharacterized protein n=1 Tax=Virgibacillus massiliensis TaxID=1462526 RepID=A0A024QBZ8_9BACI|nr:MULTISPECIES: hypothetical protein [Virgibacillus]EQB36295.1 hypothetical protein M948_14770 [Virgibacillus sp. CM-4]MYL42139.1 hypothetical protein [Virgibacillus massiliensis]CDQ39994.1 hypothetical protein BN990_02312 [Virgibacillus massiliensis]
MKLKRFLLAFVAGYLLCMLIVYLVFDFISLGFALGSVLSIVLFAIIITALKKRTK